MKTLIVAAIRCSLMFLVPSVTYAIGTQWDLDPVSGDWNTAANWTPNGIPNGPTDTATFGLSNNTKISLSADTDVSNIIFIPAATNPYSITVSSGRTLTLRGLGITNNSGLAQNFSIGDFEGVGHIRFTNSASAGNAQISCLGAEFGSSTLDFSNKATAGSANIYDFAQSINFFDHATAGTMSTSIDGDGGSLNFFGHASAGHSSVSLVFGDMTFSQNSTASNAAIVVFDFESELDFGGSSSAGSANIVNSMGLLFFLVHRARVMRQSLQAAQSPLAALPVVAQCRSSFPLQ